VEREKCRATALRGLAATKGRQSPIENASNRAPLFYELV